MLKNVLSLLLSRFYSKNESELVGHQAMPNFENAVALSLTTGNDGTYVAPADGYINVEVESSGYVNFWGGILDSASNGVWNKVAVPVSKGSTIGYHIEGQVVYAAFLILVGGGYQALKKLILQGGVLCRLKHLSSSLRRSSLSVRKGKSPLTPLHGLTVPPKSLLAGKVKTNGLTRSRRRSTDGLKLKGSAQVQSILMSVRTKTNYVREAIETVVLSLVFAGCPKEQRSTTSLLQAGQSLTERFCLSRLTVHNSALGGASC